MKKEELIKSFEAITWGKRKNDSLYMSDIRHLCEKGIPAVEIAVRNISIADFEKGFNKWLNEQKFK